MYIHIGGDFQIPIRTIVGIFDFDEITQSDNQYMMEILVILEDQLRLDTVSHDIPRSLIVCVDRAYLSPINPSTIEDRIKQAYTFIV